MKKFYEAPSVEITKFLTEDILDGSVPTVPSGTVSGTIDGEGTEIRPGGAARP